MEPQHKKATMNARERERERAKECVKKKEGNKNMRNC